MAAEEYFNFGLCVTSRSIGFGVTELIKLDEIRETGLTVYDLYRYGLTLFESKLQFIKEYASSMIHWYGRDENYLQLHYKTVPLYPTSKSFNFLMPNGIKLPIHFATPLNALGLLKVYEKWYIPQMGKKNYKEVENVKKFIPQSEQILLSTLRETVEALSDKDTPREYRKVFYENNPIPGCKWENAPENPNLINADEIISEGYDYMSITSDRRFLELIRCESLDYFKDVCTEPKGNRGLLACNNQNGMRVVDRGRYEDLATYQSRCYIEGDIVEFQYLEPPGDKFDIEGCVSLLGERPVLEELRYPVYINRDDNLCLLRGIKRSYKRMSSYFRL